MPSAIWQAKAGPRGMRLAAVVNNRTARLAPLSQFAGAGIVKVTGRRLSKGSRLSQRASSLDDRQMGSIGTVRYVNGWSMEERGVRRG
jgi:hypothetical protein